MFIGVRTASCLQVSLFCLLFRIYCISPANYGRSLILPVALVSRTTLSFHHCQTSLPFRATYLRIALYATLKYPFLGRSYLVCFLLFDHVRFQSTIFSLSFPFPHLPGFPLFVFASHLCPLFMLSFAFDFRYHAFAANIAFLQIVADILFLYNSTFHIPHFMRGMFCSQPKCSFQNESLFCHPKIHLVPTAKNR